MPTNIQALHSLTTEWLNFKAAVQPETFPASLPAWCGHVIKFQIWADRRFVTPHFQNECVFSWPIFFFFLLAGWLAARERPKGQSPYIQRLKPYTEDTEVPWQPEGSSSALCYKKQQKPILLTTTIFQDLFVRASQSVPYYDIFQLSSIICFS